MVPLIELRGAVPIGTGMGLPWHWTLIIAIIGNCLPIPIILLFVKAVLKWMRGCKINFFNKVSNWLFEKADKNRPKIDKYGAWGLFVFVAIPLPGTGAWTGALVASIFDMNKWKATLSIFGGVIGAGVIMTIVSQFGAQIVNFFAQLF
ncbi:MAG: small multi-drug export protein [Clostridia bacterium]|nr:small multi-drug export protein [Clostridia bacterium]